MQINGLLFFELFVLTQDNQKMKYSDEVIIDSIKKGTDREVLKYLYKEVLPKVKSYVRKNQGSSDEAFDVFQDAIVAVVRDVQREPGRHHVLRAARPRHGWRGRLLPLRRRRRDEGGRGGRHAGHPGARRDGRCPGESHHPGRHHHHFGATTRTVTERCSGGRRLRAPHHHQRTSDCGQ